MKSESKDIRLADGRVVTATLNFAKLKRLRGKDFNLYKKYNKIVTEGTKEELDQIIIIYTAYKCANLEDNNLLTMDEFFELMPENRYEVQEILERVYGSPRKK